jgi:small subunit ribosomal protein S20
MANHKSAAKAHRRSEKRAERNKSVKSRFKTFITKFKQSLSGDIKVAQSSFDQMQSEIMKAASKGVIHLNTASRKVSRLYNLLKAKDSSK